MKNLELILIFLASPNLPATSGATDLPTTPSPTSSLSTGEKRMKTPELINSF
jgi:hypothetical protein